MVGCRRINSTWMLFTLKEFLLVIVIAVIIFVALSVLRLCVLFLYNPLGERPERREVVESFRVFF